MSRLLATRRVVGLICALAPFAGCATLGGTTASPASSSDVAERAVPEDLPEVTQAEVAPAGVAGEQASSSVAGASGAGVAAEVAESTTGPDAAPQEPSQVVEDFSRRSPDGIDDDNPLPTDGNSAAAQAYARAVAESRANPASAATAFAEAARLTNYFYAAWFNAAVSAERAGDRTQAEAYYREALSARPDYGPALVNLSMLLEGAGRPSEAKRLVDEALRAHGERAGPHLAAAWRAYRSGDLAAAEASALRAVRLDERMVPARYVMARVFQSQERYDTARFALENALELEPGNALLRLDLGHVLVKLDQGRSAMLEYGKAVQLRPELAEAQLSYGKLLLENGDPEAALSAVERGVALAAEDARARLVLGNALRANRRYADAVGAYQKSLELDSALMSAHFNLGCLYMDNPLEGVDELDQLKLAQEQFAIFAENNLNMDAKLQERVDEYVESVDKRIERIEKRRERDRQRKLIEEAERTEAAAKAASEGGDANPDTEATAGTGDADGNDDSRPDAASSEDASSDSPEGTK